MPRRLLLTAVIACGPPLFAQEARETLVVATKESPPFAMKGEDGSWSGITIELWESVAEELDLDYELREATVPEMLAGIESGRFDAAAAVLTVTYEREQSVDFSHPYFTSGLAIGVRYEGGGGWKSVMARLLSLDFFKAVAVLAVVILIAGLVIWLLERKKNAEQFGGTAARGIGSGFWWSAVTMTTVGYGDKAPRTVPGRLVGLVWMFTSIIVISSLTATIASVLTVSQLDTGLQGPQDLPGARVGSVPGTTSASYLEDARIVFSTYASAEEAARAVAAGEIDAVVYDGPLLLHLASTELQGKLRVLPATFEPQEYAVALPEGSELREPLNRALLKVTGSPSWEEVVYRYTGR